MLTVNVVVFVGVAPAHAPINVTWNERPDFGFKVRGDVPSTRRKLARQLFHQRYPDYRVMGCATSAGGKTPEGTVLLTVRRRDELVQLAKEPGWVPHLPPRQRSRMGR